MRCFRTLAGAMAWSLDVAEGEEDVAWFFAGLAPPIVRGLWHDWSWQAHDGQRAPAGAWRVWLIMAGRGFGKTFAGAQWVMEQARAAPGARIALVGATDDEVVKVMVEGPSGLLSLERADEPMRWRPTAGVLEFANGAQAFVYSAAAGERLRGPEHHFAWADELAKWTAMGPGRADVCWDNLMMGLRLGERPRCLVTTTPRTVPVMHRIKALAGTAETRGGTADNPHAEPAFVAWAEETYGGTRLGRQELEGVLFDDVDRALFPREVLEGSRQSGTLPRFRRVVVGVDPPASAEGDACGIVVCGLGVDGVVYVLADCSVAGLRPEGWAKAVARAAEAWEADRVVAEKNQGGDMVASVLRAADERLPVRLVSASRGKAARAEPVAARFETGKVRLAGRFPALEDELAGLTAGGDYEGPGGSPDRADALVWAVTELIQPPRAEPRVRRL